VFDFEPRGASEYFAVAANRAKASGITELPLVFHDDNTVFAEEIDQVVNLAK
jgi:hypothetical protein